MGKVVFTLLILALVSSVAHAETDLMVNGYDYVLMGHSQKVELVSKLFYVFKVDKPVDDGIQALDGFYYIFPREIQSDRNVADKELAIRSIFSKPVMAIMAEILTMQPDAKADEELSNKYGLTLKK